MHAALIGAVGGSNVKPVLAALVAMGSLDKDRRHRYSIPPRPDAAELDGR
jgi:hypothetical protein